MRRYRAGGWAVLAIAGILIMFSFYQIGTLLHKGKTSHDAARLLYQVAQFQMEMLNSSLNDSAGWSDTTQLNSVKLAAYSANYTHERLVMAMGEEHLAALESLPELMQYILRLQIGGRRTIQPDELAVLQKSGALFKEMYEAYGKLLSSGGQVVSSQNDKLMKTDKVITELLHKKLLQ